MIDCRGSVRCSPAEAILGDNLADAVERAGCEGWDRSLHADLDSFKWAETDISDEFGRSRTSKVDQSFVVVSSFGTSEIRVELLEEPVEVHVVSKVLPYE